MQFCLIRRVRIPANKRKNRLFAFSSIVYREAILPGQTLRARRIWRLSVLKRLENREVICAFPTSQEPNTLRRMEAVNGS